MVYPPLETPQLLPVAAPELRTSSATFDTPPLTLTSTFTPSKPVINNHLAALPRRQTRSVITMVAILSTVGLFTWWWTLPHSPQLSAQARTQVNEYLAQNQEPASRHTPSVASSLAPNSNPDLTTAQTVSSTPLPNQLTPPNQPIPPANGSTGAANRIYQYHLTLAQGFLNKAVTLSRETASRPQTESEKATILQSLDQALAAVNTAIDADPSNGLGFLLRAKIYTTASVLRPELSQMAAQDRQIAQALGVTATQLNSDDILQFLPTQQAAADINNPNRSTNTLIADPESGTDTTLSTTTTDNQLTSTALMPAGQNSVVVNFPSLRANMALSIRVADNSPFKPNSSYRVLSRQEGVGFTITTAQTWDQDVLLEWQAVTPPSNQH